MTEAAAAVAAICAPACRERVAGLAIAWRGELGRAGDSRQSPAMRGRAGRGSFARPARRFPCSSKARAARARSWSPARCTGSARGATGASARSTARRSPTSSSKPSSSATRAARSPARSGRGPASSRKRTAARCFSTRSASCRRARRRSCCACCRSARLRRVGENAPRAGGRPRRRGDQSAACRRRRGAGAFARISCFVWRSCAFGCRRCASASRTSRARARDLANGCCAMTGKRARARARRGGRALPAPLAGQRPRAAERRVGARRCSAPARGRVSARHVARSPRRRAWRAAAAPIVSARRARARRASAGRRRRARAARAAAARPAARELGLTRQGLAKAIRRLGLEATPASGVA